MRIKGIKRGQIIELLESINIPDGVEITMEIEFEQPLDEQERLTKLNQIFGLWKNQPDLDEIFAEIDRERHADRGRAIESLDD
jgi:hypothetical protein